MSTTPYDNPPLEDLSTLLPHVLMARLDELDSVGRHQVSCSVFRTMKDLCIYCHYWVQALSPNHTDDIRTSCAPRLHAAFNQKYARAKASWTNSQCDHLRKFGLGKQICLSCSMMFGPRGLQGYVLLRYTFTLLTCFTLQSPRSARS